MSSDPSDPPASDDLASRTRSALKQFDSNMSGIFDRASFYDSDLYSQSQYPSLTKAQNCFKYTLVIVNFIILIFSGLLIGFGSVAVNSQVGTLAGSTLPVAMVVLGVFILLVALLGIVAAWKESRGLLSIYFFLLLLFTIILFAVGIAVATQSGNAASLITTGWNASPVPVQSALAAFFVCCGFTSFNDTITYLNWAAAGLTCTPIEINSQSACLPVMVSNFQTYYNRAGAFGIVFAILLLITLAGVCVLIRGIKKKREEQQIAELRAKNTTNDEGASETTTMEEGTTQEEDVVDNE